VSHRLKIRLAAVASALALAGGLALTCAGPASAVTGYELCSNQSKGTYCAYAYVSPGYGDGSPVGPLAYGDSSETWSWADTDSTHEIFYGSTSSNLCMTVEADGVVYLEACNGGSIDAADEWTTVDYNGFEYFVSYYYGGDCLTADVYADRLNLQTCNLEGAQLWYGVSP
jgi:hypothetical protein